MLSLLGEMAFRFQTLRNFSSKRMSSRTPTHRKLSHNSALVSTTRGRGIHPACSVALPSCSLIKSKLARTTTPSFRVLNCVHFNKLITARCPADVQSTAFGSHSQDPLRHLSNCRAFDVLSSTVDRCLQRILRFGTTIVFPIFFGLRNPLCQQSCRLV